ncbi:MAG TPA: ATP-binding SpoIIE family protein phosphatase [Candidatus Baltobacteraceae bacterium]|nr:ATP-binding SpoIIE family protein phosphatase [Candidatus Baltobacteraceae bacterium]
METLSTVQDLEWIPVEDLSAAGRVRRSAAGLAKRLGFDEHRAGEVAIAGTELGTNLARHAEHGAIALRVRRCGDRAAVELIALDAGPGMADLDALASDGRSTRGTLGIGLGAVIRLASRFDAHSVPGRGTAMVATFWPGEPPGAPAPVGMLTRAMHGQPVCGDACAVRNGGTATTLVLVDGLGHGPLAAAAAHEALRSFAEASADESPARLLQRFDGALRSTRGAAASVVRIDRDAGTLAFAGIGNVAVWLDDGERRRALLGRPGIVGARAKEAPEQTVPFQEGALVVLHSDGLTSKWDLNAYPGLRRRDPELSAATLLRDAGIRHDDASVIVAKAS